jgi:hypothetical protein
MRPRSGEPDTVFLTSNKSLKLVKKGDIRQRDDFNRFIQIRLRSLAKGFVIAKRAGVHPKLPPMLGVTERLGYAPKRITVNDACLLKHSGYDITNSVYARKLISKPSTL